MLALRVLTSFRVMQSSLRQHQGHRGLHFAMLAYADDVEQQCNLPDLSTTSQTAFILCQFVVAFWGHGFGRSDVTDHSCR